MNRSLVTYATVLSIKPLGENNSSVCLLTRTEGVIYAVLYGGPKSRLKSLVSTWNTGTVYLSFSKNNYKISDFDNLESYEILELIGRKRGMLISGGEVNTERAANTLLDEYRAGKLGAITLDSVMEG